MPYFFASVESNLATSRAASLASGPNAQKILRLRHELAGATIDGVRIEEPQASGLPVWDTVRNELRATLASGIFAQRVQPLHARLEGEGTLVLETPTRFLQCWVESRLRLRIEEVLRMAGYDIQVLIVVAQRPESIIDASS